jgi:hypothetical protein
VAQMPPGVSAMQAAWMAQPAAFTQRVALTMTRRIGKILEKILAMRPLRHSNITAGLHVRKQLIYHNLQHHCNATAIPPVDRHDSLRSWRACHLMVILSLVQSLQIGGCPLHVRRFAAALCLPLLLFCWQPPSVSPYSATILTRIRTARLSRSSDIAPPA